MSAKGWCPGVLRPMEVVDGLLVRIKPPMSRVTRAQVEVICDGAMACGSGQIELTTRANLQVRAVRDAAHPQLAEALSAAGLADPTREIEARRQIMVTPDWRPGDETTALHDRIVAGLHQLPALPEKLGIAIDTGAMPLLQDASADFRFERAAGGLLLRADGAAGGHTVTPDTAAGALTRLAEWFATARQPGTRRVADLAANVRGPEGWETAPAPDGAHWPLGTTEHGQIVRLPDAGRIAAKTLMHIVTTSGARALRLMPDRCMLLEGVTGFDDPAVITHETEDRLGGAG